MERELSRVYASAGGPTTTLWELPDVDHTHGLRDHPAAYETRVVGLVGRTLVDSAV